MKPKLNFNIVIIIILTLSYFGLNFVWNRMPNSKYSTLIFLLNEKLLIMALCTALYMRLKTFISMICIATIGFYSIPQIIVYILQNILSGNYIEYIHKLNNPTIKICFALFSALIIIFINYCINSHILRKIINTFK